MLHVFVNFVSLKRLLWNGCATRLQGLQMFHAFL